jgi:Copper binding periplasmic protein CusF
MNIRIVSIAALMIFGAVFLSLLFFVTRSDVATTSLKAPTPPATSPESAARADTSAAPTTPTAAPQGTAGGTTGVASYTVRGKLISLPSAYGKQSLQIHHEAIPDFKGRSGAVTGMKEMIMPFPDIAPQVSLSGLSPGAAVEFTFEVRWDAPPRTLVVRLVPLAPETPLHLSEVVEQGR